MVLCLPMLMGSSGDNSCNLMWVMCFLSRNTYVVTIGYMLCPFNLTAINYIFRLATRSNEVPVSIIGTAPSF